MLMSMLEFYLGLTVLWALIMLGIYIHTRRHKW